jgi:hypothetical protein
MNALITLSIVVAIGAAGVNCAAQDARIGQKSDSGSICVLPNPPERPTRISPGGDYNPDTLMLRIDKSEPIHWPHKDGIRIDDLNLHERHLVALTSDGKRIQSFWLKFWEYEDTNLCISFDGYQGANVGDPKNALWCKANKRHCWP